MIKIAPSILSCDFSKLAEEVRKLEKGRADFLHLDIMDGHFVPNLTIGPPIIKVLRKNCNLPFDTHLMIDNPQDFLEEYAQAGSDIITVHIEVCRKNFNKIIRKIRQLKLKVGVALKPATPLGPITKYLSKVDLVLIMSVNPGFGGQKFMPEVLTKIRKLYRLKKEKKLKFDIGIDGGITDKNIVQATASGANFIVAGAYVFSHKNVANAIKNLRKKAITAF